MQRDLPGLDLVNRALPADAAIDRKGMLALFLEKIHIRTNTSENHFQGFVKELLYLGYFTVYIVQTESNAKIETLLANSAAGGAKCFEVGDTVDAARKFDAEHYE